MATRRRKRPPVRRRSTRGSFAEQQLAALFAAAGFPPPEREVLCVPGRLWRYDFAWREQLVAVELHGATFSRGRHVTGIGFGIDREKMNAAQLPPHGWVVLEYTTADLRKRPDYILAQVGRALGCPVGGRA